MISRHIAANIEERLANQVFRVEVIRVEIIRIYVSLSSKWKPCHKAINSGPRNLRTTLKKYFCFSEIIKKVRVEARSRIAIVRLFPNFLSNYKYNFENIFTIWS